MKGIQEEREQQYLITISGGFYYAASTVQHKFFKKDLLR